MDVRHINPFMFGIKNVFSTMLGTDILFSRPRIKGRDEANADVSAIIGFSGEARGAVALCFPIRTALKIASTFAGVDLTREHPDFADALGELANMVAGQAKSQLEGINTAISLPQVVAGQKLEILNTHSTPTLLLPCDSMLGHFSTEVTMMLSKTQAAQLQQASINAES